MRRLLLVENDRMYENNLIKFVFQREIAILLFTMLELTLLIISKAIILKKFLFKLRFINTKAGDVKRKKHMVKLRL